jgi:hypothetical protein
MISPLTILRDSFGSLAIQGYVEMKSPVSSQGKALPTTLLYWGQHGGSRPHIRRKIQCLLDRQHLVQWRGLAGTMRQAQELISGPHIAAKTTLMSFNRAQSRVVTGLLTGHNTLRRHLHIMGLLDSPLCRKCGAGEETSAYVLCECEVLVTLRHIYLGSFFLDPEDVGSLSLRVIWNFFRRRGLLWLGPSEGAQRACEGLHATDCMGSTHTYSLLISHSV